MIIGIDPATTKLAVVLFDGMEYFWEEVKFKGPYSPETALAASKWTRKFFRKYVDPKRATAFLEAPVVARGAVQGTIKQSMVSGAIQAAVLGYGVPVYLVPISSWKKTVVKKGNASKPEVKKHMVAHWPFLKGESQDVVDAMGVLQHGKITLEKASHL